LSADQKVLMAASMPSTGEELLKAFQLRSRSRMAWRRAGVSGIHFPEYYENM